MEKSHKYHGPFRQPSTFFLLSESFTFTPDSLSFLAFSLFLSLFLFLSLSLFTPFPRPSLSTTPFHTSFDQTHIRKDLDSLTLHAPCIFTHIQMSPTNMISPQVALHVYTDFDSTVVLEDTGNTLLEHEIGAKELERLDRLPETNPGHISLRKAEDMKWDKLRLTVQEAADILVGPLDGLQSSSRKPFDQTDDSTGTTRSYRVRLDPAFKEFHRYCKEHHIPITVVSIGIQPLIVEILNRHLGVDHGIEVRANGLTVCPDGSWKIVWRDSSPFGVEKGRALREARANDLLNPTSDQILWCGDGSSDFPAALVADIRLARQNTTLEKLLRANQIPHRAFTTFRTVQETVEDWLREHPERPSAGSLSDISEP